MEAAIVMTTQRGERMRAMRVENLEGSMEGVKEMRQGGNNCRKGSERSKTDESRELGGQDGCGEEWGKVGRME